MTIEALFALPGEDLEKITDAQLEIYLTPYFPHTRPRNIAHHSETIGAALVESFSPELLAKMEELRKKNAPVSLKRK